MKTNEVVISLLAGVAIGSIIGVLFAPRKGRKLRKKMYAKGSEITESLKSKFGDVITNVADSFELAQKEVEDKIALGKSKLSVVKDEFMKSNL